MTVGPHTGDRAHVDLPLPAVLAAVLVASGARLVVVGGTARRLRGASRRPRDLDIVLAEGAASTAAVAAVLARLATAPSGPEARRPLTVDTSLGRLDVVDTVSVHALPVASDVVVLDVAVPVAVRP